MSILHCDTLSPPTDSNGLQRRIVSNGDRYANDLVKAWKEDKETFTTGDSLDLIILHYPMQE